MVLVTVCSCPQIIADPRLGEDLVSDDLPIEDIVDGVCARSVKINIVTVQTLELTGQVCVAHYFIFSVYVEVLICPVHAGSGSFHTMRRVRHPTIDS